MEVTSRPARGAGVRAAPRAGWLPAERVSPGCRFWSRAVRGLGEAGAGRRDPGIRGRQQGEQERGIIVEAGERHPCNPAILSQSPLRQQGRLAVTRGRSDADHAAIARASRLDEPGAAHRTRARLRDRELGVEQKYIERNDRPRRPRGSSDMIGSCGSMLGCSTFARRNGAEAARAIQHEPALRRFHAI